MMNAMQAMGDVALQQGLLSQQSLSKRHASVGAAAKDFESMFMAQMLQPMMASVEVDGMFGGGHGEEAMRGLLVQEYGKAMAAGSGSGLSDAVQREMLRMQEKADGGGVKALAG